MCIFSLPSSCIFPFHWCLCPIQGLILLQGSHVNELPPNPDEPGKHLFEIAPGRPVFLSISYVTLMSCVAHLNSKHSDTLVKLSRPICEIGLDRLLHCGNLCFGCNCWCDTSRKQELRCIVALDFSGAHLVCSVVWSQFFVFFCLLYFVVGANAQHRTCGKEVCSI